MNKRDWKLCRTGWADARFVIRHNCDVDYKSIYGNVLLARVAMADSSECLMNKKVKAVVQAYLFLPKLSQ